jgi:hypothetical protein
VVRLYAFPFIVKLLIKHEANESIIAITGKAGFHPLFGIRVNQISFVVYDRSTGHSNIQGVRFILRTKDPHS